MASLTSFRLFFTCSVVAGLIGFSGTPAATQARDLERGAALIAEARTALGGDERLRAVKALDVRGDFKRMAGQMTIDGDLQIRLELPDKLRRDEDLSLPGGGPTMVRTEVLNGNTVWDENSGGAMFFGRFGRGNAGAGQPGGRDAGARGRAIDPAQLEEAQRRARQTDLARFALIWLLSADNVAWIGTAEAPDGKADVLEVTPPAGPVVRLFLDATSHMPLMLTWQGAAPQLMAARRGGRGARGDAPPDAPSGPPPQATLRVTLGDYKAVNGVMLPHLITRAVNDMTIEEWTIRSYRIDPSFRSDVFTK
jgi:hypothetical protein